MKAVDVVPAVQKIQRGTLARALVLVSRRNVGAALSALLVCAALGITSIASPGRAAGADTATCTEVIGFSQTNQWFYSPQFLGRIDEPKWQLRWQSGGDLLQWGSGIQYTGWTDSPIHPCASGSSAPDRVIYNITLARYALPASSTVAMGGNDVGYIAAYIEYVISNIRTKYPNNPAIYLQPVVAGPALTPCETVDPNSEHGTNRATWNAPYFDAAMSYVIARHPEIQIAATPEVESCFWYSDWAGHIEGAKDLVGANIGNTYRARFGIGAPLPTGSPLPTSTPTATPTASPSPTPTSTASPSPTPTATASSSPTPTPTATNMVTVINFNSFTVNQCCPPLNGLYGGVNWGTGVWALSGPYAGFNSTSISYPNAGPTSADLTFTTPSVITLVDATNGNGGTTTVSIICVAGGSPTVTRTMNSNTTATIATGWTAPCSTVRLGSTNGWWVNFDNIAYR